MAYRDAFTNGWRAYGTSLSNKANGFTSTLLEVKDPESWMDEGTLGFIAGVKVHQAATTPVPRVANEVIDIVSAETGEIFAESLTGLGSARRWIAARGLTEDHVDTDAEVDETMAQHAEHIAEWESKKTTHPQHLEEIEATIARMKAAPPTRYLYVKEDSCPRVSFPTEFIPAMYDEDGTLVFDGYWGGSRVSTMDFAEAS